MPLTNITNAEKKRFKKLQEDGMLPSQALRKIETERRLGIIPEDKPGRFSITKENWWFYTAMGAIGAGMLYIYLRSSSSTQTQVQTQTQAQAVSLPTDNTESIEYEDVYEIEIEDYY